MTVRFIRSTAIALCTLAMLATPRLTVAQSAPKAGSMAGTWNVSLIGDHVIPVALVLDQEGNTLKGTLMMMGKDVAMSGEITGTSFTLTGKAAVGLQQHPAPGAPAAAATSPAPAPGATSELKLTGAFVEDGALAGTFAIPGGELKWTAERLRQRPTGASSSTPTVAAANIAGKWSMTMAMAPEAMTASVEFQQTGSTLTGTMTNEHLGVLKIVGTVASATATFSADGNAQGQVVHIEFTGKVTDGAIAGDMVSMMGTVKWSAERVKK